MLLLSNSEKTERNWSSTRSCSFGAECALLLRALLSCLRCSHKGSLWLCFLMRWQEMRKAFWLVGKARTFWTLRGLQATHSRKERKARLWFYCMVGRSAEVGLSLPFSSFSFSEVPVYVVNRHSSRLTDPKMSIMPIMSIMLTIVGIFNRSGAHWFAANWFLATKCIPLACVWFINVLPLALNKYWLLLECN